MTTFFRQVQGDAQGSRRKPRFIGPNLHHIFPRSQSGWVRIFTSSIVHSVVMTKITRLENEYPVCCCCCFLWFWIKNNIVALVAFHGYDGLFYVRMCCVCFFLRLDSTLKHSRSESESKNRSSPAVESAREYIRIYYYAQFTQSRVRQVLRSTR